MDKSYGLMQFVSINMILMKEGATLAECKGSPRSVPAWLGEEANKSDAAIELVRKFSHLAIYANSEYVEACLRHNPGCLGEGCWLALHDLMQRPYWERLWIIQELFLADQRS